MASSTGAGRVACWAAALLFAAAAHAQPAPPANLPDDLVRASELTNAQRQQVESFARDAARGLKSADPAAVQRAREALLEPLVRDGIPPSLRFRLAMSGAISQDLELVAAGADDFAAANALLVAGELSTNATLGVLASALQDERESVRYAAALGMGRLLRLASIGEDALAADREGDAVAALGDALKKEPSAIVVDGILLGFDALEQDPALNASVLTVMADGVAEQMRKRRAGALDADTLFDEALVRAASLARTHLIEVRDVQPATTRTLAVMSGRTLVYLLWRIDPARGRLDAAEERVILSVAQASDSVLIFAKSVLDPRGAEVFDTVREAFEAWVQSGDAAAAREAVRVWIDRLTAPPFGANARDFE